MDGWPGRCGTGRATRPEHRSLRWQYGARGCTGDYLAISEYLISEYGRSADERRGDHPHSGLG